MDSQKSLILIASISMRVATTLVRLNNGRKTVESFQLDKIVAGSSAALETLNKKLLLNDGNVDNLLADWLHSDEPQACLTTLGQMEKMLNTKPACALSGFFKPSGATHTKNIYNEAIGLFQTHRSHFYVFLESVDVWNPGNGTRLPSFAAQPSAPYMKSAEENDAVQLVQSTNMGTSPSFAEKVAKQSVDENKLESILKRLNAWNCKETHRRNILQRQAGTCAWLPTTDTFKTWRSAKDSFLWLNGEVGVGKSVLAASVIENLQSTLTDGEVLVFFYCDFRNERSTSAAEVMRSILSQLLQRFSWNVVDHGGLIDELVKWDHEGSSTIDEVMLLARFVSRVVEQFIQQPFIVIDALDECSDVEKLLDALGELRKGGLRLLATSRPLQVIRESLSTFPSISVDAMKDEVSTDIALHVKQVLKSHRRLKSMDHNLKEEIYSALVQKADGMFLWVQCQLNTLKRCVTTMQVREALQNLPDDLDATYERVLLNIDSAEEGKVVPRALQWLVAALEPLQLSQIMEGLSIDLGCQVLDLESRPVHGPALLDVLGSLVSYDESTDVVVLSHFSVKEYLTRKSIRTKHPTYHIDQQLAHTQLALLCMCYIVAYIKRNQLSGDYQVPAPNTSRTPRCYDDNNVAGIERPRASSDSSITNPLLLEYVLSNGFGHLTNVNPMNQAVLKAIINLASHAQQHPSEWEWLCEKASSRIPWPALKHDLVLYILITAAPEPMLRIYLQRPRLKMKDGTNPLIYAARFAKIQHSRTLLSRGVSLDRSGWDVGTSCRLLPIEVAVESAACRDIVDLFLEAGSLVPESLFHRALGGKTCPFPGCNVAKLLKTDQFCEWATDVSSDELLRVLDPMRYMWLFHAYQPSEEDVEMNQRRLVQIDCDPYARFNEAFFRRAARAGHVSTVKQMLSLKVPLPHDIILYASCGTMIRFLLDSGSNVHVISPVGATSLHKAISSFTPEDDSLESVRVLHESGCSPSACDFAGETPFHRAVACGYISIIEYFLLVQVKLPHDILLVSCPLARSGTASAIQLLITNGADVRAVAADGNTPLHIALCRSYENPNECMETVKTLTGAGCDPCPLNALGKTPFDVAAEHASPTVLQYLLSQNVIPNPSILLSVSGREASGASPIIELLLSKGVVIPSMSPDGNTPLHLSMQADSELECLKRLETLIGVGCDPGASNSAGENPFHIAAKRGYLLVMQYLLTVGVLVPSDIIFTLLAMPSYSFTHKYSRVIRFLLEKKVDIDVVGEDGKTLVHFAAMFHEEEDALEAVQLLVRAGCNASALNSAQETPLHIAARSGYISVVNYLLSLDMPLPSNVLLAASNAGSKKTQVICYLLDKGADASVVTTDGDTPLHLLLAEGEEMDRLESAKILIGAGCDPCALNLAGETPLHVVAKSGFVTILKYLLAQGALLPRDIFRTSAAVTIRFLLERVVDSKDSFSSLPTEDKELLHRVLSSKASGDDDEHSLECTRSLVNLGWNPSFRNSSGETPMHIAARRGRISIVQYLLQSVPLPADILLAAVPAERHWTTHITVCLVYFLIREGASVNIATPNGDTPLHLALRCNFTPQHRGSLGDSWKLVEILLNGGSDPDARNVDGQTPLDLADAEGLFFKENFVRLVRNARAQHQHGIGSTQV